jgi:hypothetical protein
MTSFNVGERIKQVRAIEAKIDAMQTEFDAKLKPFEDLADTMRAELLEYLNTSGQKSAKTAWGTAYWRTRTTYRVEDKEAFRAHVVGHTAWELTTWAAAGVACESFISEHKEPPPGIALNTVRLLSVIAPEKPRAVKANGADAPPPSE